MIAGAIAGYFIYRKTIVADNKSLPPDRIKFNFKKSIFVVLSVVSILVLFGILTFTFNGETAAKMTLIRKLAFTFSSMSLTLFGGGYVVIPVIHEVVVDGLHWLTSKEFADAIAMGQITPGPIFISVVFIGYKVAGIAGAITATLAIFIPPGILMIFCSRFMDYIKSSKAVTAVFKGLRPAVIGMIFSAAYTIAKEVDLGWPTAVIFISVLVLSVKFKVNVVYLIPASGIFGMLIF